MDANEDGSLYAELASLRINHCRTSAQPYPSTTHPNPNPNPHQPHPNNTHRRTNSSSHHQYTNNYHHMSTHRSHHVYANPKSTLTRSGPELLHINLPERKHGVSRGGAGGIGNGNANANGTGGDQYSNELYLHRSNMNSSHSNSHHHTNHHRHHSNNSSGGGGGGGGGLLSSALACLCRPKQPLTLNSTSANSSSVLHPPCRAHEEQQYEHQHALQLEALAAIEETRDMWEWQMEQQAALASQENDFLEKRYSCTTHDTISINSMHNSTQTSPLINRNTPNAAGLSLSLSATAAVNPSHDCRSRQQRERAGVVECQLDQHQHQHQHHLLPGQTGGDQVVLGGPPPSTIPNACNAEALPSPFNNNSHTLNGVATTSQSHLIGMLAAQAYDCLANNPESISAQISSAAAATTAMSMSEAHAPAGSDHNNIHLHMGAGAGAAATTPPSEHNRSMDNISNCSSYFIRTSLDGNRSPHHIAPDPDHVVLLFEAALLRCRSEMNLFCRVYMQQMVLSGYSLIKTLTDMEPNTVFYRKVHASYALEARICDVMFRCFENDSFDDTGVTQILDQEARVGVRFHEYLTIKAVDAEDALAMHSATYDGGFHRYCVNKSEEVARMCRRWRMSYRKAGERDRFMEAFLRAAKSVWMLHRLANATHPCIHIIRVARGMDAHPLYVESVLPPPPPPPPPSASASACPHCPPPNSSSSSSSPPKVQFMVMPGFISPKLVFKAKVYQHYHCYNYMCSECTAASTDNHHNNNSRSSAASSSSSTLASSD